MLNKALRYGGSAGLALCVIFLVTLQFAEGDSPNYRLAEALGYISILLSLLVVYAGIRSYRDKDLGGVISFKNALQVGLLTTLFIAALFALFDTLYVTFINPDFYTEYLAHEIGEMRSEGASQQELDAHEAKYEIFQGPLGLLINGAVMFLTVFLIGFIVSVSSALILRTKSAGSQAQMI